MPVTCQTVNVQAVGNLNISSTPSGAEIWLAPTGQSLIDQGTTTVPSGRLISGLVIGNYDVKLTLPGYFDWYSPSPYTISEGTTNNVSATLIPATGNASFSSIPSGAEIWIDGSYTGLNTPNTVTGLSPGTHTYQLKLTDYYDSPIPPGSLPITGGQTTTIPTITMVLIIGAIDLSSIPTNTEIWLAPTGQTLVFQTHTPAVIGGLTPGVPYTYELRHTDFYPKDGTFTLVDGETITKSETLTPVPCPSLPRYSGDTVHLQATPTGGIGPYNVDFRKEGVTICTYLNSPEYITVYCDYLLTDADIAAAISGTIDFSVYITDQCPTSPQFCTEHCTINLGCISPVCNFTVT